MIVTKSANLWTLVRYIGRPLASLFIFDLAVVVGYVFLGWNWVGQPEIPVSIFGGVIGVLTSFRNTSAYARWWEARTIWGAIVNNSRSFAREVLSMIAASGVGEEPTGEVCAMKRRLVLLQVAYVHALRNQLRDLPVQPELTGLIPEQEIESLSAQANPALAIQQKIALLVAECHRQGWIDSIQWASLDRTLSSLMDSQGACERINSTPMPRQYDMFIRRFIGMYCLVLPLGMVESLRLLTPIGSTFVGFIFLALDQIGRDLEDPFENLPHDIAMTAITRNIEINLKQMIGEKDLPEPLAPVNGVLW
jgi:putative membrane protein